MRVAITGIGLVTPLGKEPREVLRRIEAGESAAVAPGGFDASLFACPVCAPVTDFRPQEYVSEAKMARLMNRDAQLAVAAARLALADADMKVGENYQPEEIGLFGATGLAGLPLAEVAPLIKASIGSDGGFDLARFGQAGLRAVSPILSFKILSNMPLCFVSINENIQGSNGIYTPWEGQGAQAIESGIRALQGGDARCVLAGGCDVKTHELAFLSLEQQGLFRSWRETGKGIVPGEGAAFLVLEDEESARARGARIYARVSSFSLRAHKADALERLGPIVGQASCLPQNPFANAGETRAEAGRMPALLHAIVSAANGDVQAEQEEQHALTALQISASTVVYLKKQAGDLFAAAAALQVSIGALLAERGGGHVLANCFGHGCTQAAFVLEKP